MTRKVGNSIIRYLSNRSFMVNIYHGMGFSKDHLYKIGKVEIDLWIKKLEIFVNMDRKEKPYNYDFVLLQIRARVKSILSKYYEVNDFIIEIYKIIV